MLLRFTMAFIGNTHSIEVLSLFLTVKYKYISIIVHANFTYIIPIIIFSFVVKHGYNIVLLFLNIYNKKYHLRYGVTKTLTINIMILLPKGYGP